MLICSLEVSARLSGSECFQTVFRDLLDETGNDSTLKPEKRADIVAQMFQILLGQTTTSEEYSLLVIS